MRIGLGEDRVQRSEHFSAKWKLAVTERERESPRCTQSESLSEEVSEE